MGEGHELVGEVGAHVEGERAMVRMQEYQWRRVATCAEGRHGVCARCETRRGRVDAT
jgi:hypothetical protein